MWHAFSYDLIPNLKYENAINELKKREKNDVYIFFQNSDRILEEKNLTYEKLLKIWPETYEEADLYVVDKIFEWTFVLTHETILRKNDFYIGPFFTTIDMINNLSKKK